MQQKILAPLAGRILKVHITPGARVEEDDEVLVVEALKMETPIFAPCTGAVKEVCVSEGDSVEEDDVLAVIEE
ncbi:MAG: acetyl-CoA carboxylase biotin carboxyl carrier protein subunit [Planctomycetes bacterium]|nr:acetyl-CoA carboxylase biotin carboxyl carrier protein subunit [Planctomycetota bacterium]